MIVKIKPSKLKGSIVVPPSKSISHRAIIAASLASGKSILRNIALSNDILATINGMRALGACISIHDDCIEIIGIENNVKDISINCKESGSTLRFLIPLALVKSDSCLFTGENHLVNRPLDSYIDIFREKGIKYTNNSLPMRISGSLKSGTYNIRGDISSQFISGLLFALPLLDGDSYIVLSSKLESVGYVDLTISTLKDFGIEIINYNYEKFYIKGNQKYISRDYSVEGDYSQAAFFLVANVLGSKIEINGLNLNSKQGDKKILSDLNDFGSHYDIFNDSIVMNDFNNLTPATIDLCNTPDLGPIECVLASHINGKSRFINAYRLRLKECDRISAMHEELTKMGVNFLESENEMIIEGKNILKGGRFSSHNDHRIFMSLAIASTICSSDMIIDGAECVRKSYPNFIDEFIRLGGKIEVLE